MKLVVLGTLSLLAGLAIASPPAEDLSIVLKGATAFVGDGRTIANASIVVRDGRIESVGAGATAPVAARAIDQGGQRPERARLPSVDA